MTPASGVPIHNTQGTSVTGQIRKDLLSDDYGNQRLKRRRSQINDNPNQASERIAPTKNVTLAQEVFFCTKCPKQFPVEAMLHEHLALEHSSLLLLALEQTTKKIAETSNQPFIDGRVLQRTDHMRSSVVVHAKSAAQSSKGNQASIPVSAKSEASTRSTRKRSLENSPQVQTLTRKLSGTDSDGPSQTRSSKRKRALDDTYSAYTAPRKLSFLTHDMDSEANLSKRRRFLEGASQVPKPKHRRSAAAVVASFHVSTVNRRRSLEANFRFVSRMRMRTPSVVCTGSTLRKRSIIVIGDDDPPLPPNARRRSLDTNGKRQISAASTYRPNKEGEDSWPCNYCSDVFSNTWLKHEHMSQSHSDEYLRLRIPCWKDRCNCRFRSVRELTSHLSASHRTESTLDIATCREKTPAKVKCFACSSMLTKQGLRQHIMNKHPEFWESGKPTEQMKKKYCSVCRGKINRKTLKQHIHLDHPDLWNRELSEEEMLNRDDSRTEDSRWAICLRCNKRYTAEGLPRHTALMHSMTETAA